MVDLETTSLGQDCEIVAIAVIGSRGELLLDTLVRPRGAIAVEAQRVHDIDPAEVASAPPFQDVHPDLASACRGKTLVAFHADFDLDVLGRECRLRGLPRPGTAWECALRRYAEWRGFRASLGTIAEIEGLPSRRLHCARGDAELTWLLIQRMAR